MTTFKDLGLSEGVLATLATEGFVTPTPIQAQAIPLVMEGHDLIGLAQTGTGKTAAFGLPMIEKMLADGKRADPRNIRALVLAPTRELVNQIAANLKTFVKKSPLRVGLVVGGASINKQSEQLGRGVEILVATPGRLLDLIARKAVTLTQARYLVLDEADQMLDLGFIHDLRKISKLVPKNRQTLLFSATMPKAIAELASEYLSDPKRVEVSPPGKAADKVEQYVHFVAGQSQKTEILKKTLNENPDGRAMVFSRTKHGAEKLMKHLDHTGFSVASIHGNKSQGQRERALKAFRDGEIRVLVATDVAARGIDIPGVTHVYNYDLPEVPDAYVHRIGRTARAGRDGIAIAFCAPDEIRLLRDIERLMNIDIAVASGEVPADRARPKGARGGNGARNAQRATGDGHNQRRARPQGGSDNAPRTERAAPSPFAGDELIADGQPQRKQHRKGQGPAAQAAHEAAAAKRGNRGGRPGQKQGQWRNRGGNGGGGQQGQRRQAGGQRRDEA
ncbi:MULTISPECIES: DEAD/DEAH box helicase [unclassified Rhizobium]|uniref:DEAD/DEAH box helicase n=1 Tax=unclassified Rhizobium TaxID=2613769 RepID=UPI0006FCC999|nr:MULTISPECIES: DEAD/DEAH box helicase [unclassified Rhizobium]KQV38209.1 RNA helicase [Rhizobium sp. Root1212]KRD30866.1 RNA helicase [Rhizobium sp. Root268]